VTTPFSSSINKTLSLIYSLPRHKTDYRLFDWNPIPPRTRRRPRTRI